LVKANPIYDTKLLSRPSGTVWPHDHAYRATILSGLSKWEFAAEPGTTTDAFHNWMRRGTIGRQATVAKIKAFQIR
jgi:hypothetical protein